MGERKVQPRMRKTVHSGVLAQNVGLATWRTGSWTLLSVVVRTLRQVARGRDNKDGVLKGGRAANATHLDFRKFVHGIFPPVLLYPCIPKPRFRSKGFPPRGHRPVPRLAEDVVELLLQAHAVPPPEQERPKNDGCRNQQKQEKSRQEGESARC